MPSEYSDQAEHQSSLTGLHCLYEKTLHPWLSKLPSKDSDQTAPLCSLI